jgi:hypothetical protein
MTNAEIALKLIQLDEFVEKIWASKSTHHINDPHITPFNEAKRGMNAAREALKVAITPQPVYFSSDWRDAVEVNLVYAETLLRLSAKRVNVNLDDVA